MPADDIGDGNVGSEGPVQPKVRSSVEYESLDARSNRLEALSSGLKADMADMIASQNRLPSTDSEADVEERLKVKVDRSGLREVARQAGLAQREIRGRLNLKKFSPRVTKGDLWYVGERDRRTARSYKHGAGKSSAATADCDVAGKELSACFS